MILHHSQYFINVQYSKGVDVFTVNLEVSILDTSHGYTAGFPAENTVVVVVRKALQK